MEVLKPIALYRAAAGNKHRTQVRMVTTRMSIAFLKILLYDFNSRGS